MLPGDGVGLPTCPLGHLSGVSAREHRDELLVLLAIVLATAVGLGAVALLQRDGGGDGTGETVESTPAAGPSASTAPPEPTPDPTADPAPGVRVRGAAYVQPCGVLPREEVVDVFGPFSTEGFTRQQYLGRTPGPRELAAAARLAYGGLTSSCLYVLGDAPGHTVEVVVTQFPSEARAARRWTSLRSGGAPVPGTQGGMIALADRRSFVVRGDDVLVEVRFASANDALRGRPMSAREVRAQLPQMRRVHGLVVQHLRDGSATADAQSVSAGLGTAVAGTPYLDPCEVFEAADLATIGDVPAGAVVVDTSYRRDEQFTDAPVATCERSGSRAGRSTFAVLEVRVARDEAGARQVQAKHLDARYARRTRVARVDTDAGRAYVVDVGGTAELPWRRRAMHLVVGPYELQLTAVRDVGPGRPSGRAVTDEQLAAALTAVAARVP